MTVNCVPSIFCGLKMGWQMIYQEIPSLLSCRKHQPTCRQLMLGFAACAGSLFSVTGMDFEELEASVVRYVEEGLASCTSI